jgi:stress-induced morphogen
MSSHPTDFQGSVIDALREAIEQQIHNSRAAVTGGGGHFSIEVTSPMSAGACSRASDWCTAQSPT